jgi:hypothetical protein
VPGELSVPGEPGTRNPEQTPSTQLPILLAILFIPLSEIAVIVNDGFTPGFAEIIEPSKTYIFS